MEGNRRRNIVLTAPNRLAEAAGDSGSESTRSYSVESGVTVDGSRGRSRESCGDVEDVYSGWTNEKHNSYLAYLEESFVEKLYDSMRLRRWLAEGKTCRPFATLDPPTNSHKSPNQIEFEKNQTFWDTAADHYVLGSPWTDHLADSNKKHGIRTSRRDYLMSKQEIYGGCDMNFSDGSSRNRELEGEYYSYHGNLVSSTAEASDQNFTDDGDTKEKSSCAPVSKRLKRTTKVETSTSDQVVPFGKMHEREISNVNQCFSIRDGRKSLIELCQTKPNQIAAKPIRT